MTCCPPCADRAFAVRPLRATPCDALPSWDARMWRACFLPQPPAGWVVIEAIPTDVLEALLAQDAHPSYLVAVMPDAETGGWALPEYVRTIVLATRVVWHRHVDIDAAQAAIYAGRAARVIAWVEVDRAERAPLVATVAALGGEAAVLALGEGV